MKILAIDTSCDETAVAVTQDTKILSNVIWSQASAHAKFGGVMPSLAKRMHQERIDWVVNRAMTNAKCQMINLDAIAVTTGPGLAIALGVGIEKAKELATKYNKKLIAVNHLEGHLLSPLAQPNKQIGKSANLQMKFPALGLVISGKNTLLVKIVKIGKYITLATITDDALGEALDKAARMLGLGYPGGAIFEKFAKDGDKNKYTLPIPIVGQESRQIFTYSGLKTAMVRLVESEKPLTKQKVYDLAACFQNVAFEHLIRVLRYALSNDYSLKTKDLFVGGGVAANVEVRKRLRSLTKEFGIKAHFPYSKKLYGDNAAMIGVTAYFKAQRDEFISITKIDRDPQLKL